MNIAGLIVLSKKRVAIAVDRRLKETTMPSPRDITGDLVRMRNRQPLAESPRPVRRTSIPTRPMAFDPVLWISSAVILLGLAMQGAFMFWML